MVPRLLWFWLAVLLTSAAAAQQLSPPAPASPAPSPADPRATPRGAVFGFLEAARAGDYRRAATFLETPEGRGHNPAELARQLKTVLDRKLHADLGTLSNSPDGDRADDLEPDQELIGPVELGNRTVDLILTRRSRSGEPLWRFSAGTVALIPQLYQEIGDSRIERYLPAALVDTRFLDAPVWQWLALLLLAALAMALGRLVARLIFTAFRPIVRRTTTQLDDQLIGGIARPLRFLLALLVFRIGLAWITPPLLVRLYLIRALIAFGYLGVAWLVSRFIDVAAAEATTLMSRRHRASATSAVPLARRTAKVLIFLLAIILTLDNWGYNTTALLAGLGVGGLAVALAAQKTIENLFGGVAIISDRPVLVGDFCKFGDSTGTVEDIGLRSTRIRTLERTVVTVPNGQFSSMLIENFARRDKIWFHPLLRIRRDATLDQLRYILAESRRLLAEHPKIDPGARRVRFIDISPDSFDLEVFSYVLTTDYDEFLSIKEELLLGLLDVVEKAGTGIALQTQISMMREDAGPDEARRRAASDMVAAWRERGDPNDGPALH